MSRTSPTENIPLVSLGDALEFDQLILSGLRNIDSIYSGNP